MRSITPKPARLGLFWLGIQVVWGALLGVSLQARASELGGAHAIAVYGLLAASGAAVAAVTQIAVGMLSDRRRAAGSRRVEFYAIGAFLAAGALVCFYSAGTIAQLVAATLVLQLAMNVAIGPYQAAIPDFVSDDRMGTASSWMAALQSLGNAGGALVAALVPNLHLDAAIIAGTLLVTCALTMVHVRTLPLRAAALSPLRVTRAFVDLFISRALVFLGFYTLLGYLYFYVRDTLGGSTKLLTGELILVVTVSAAIGAAIAALAANRLDRRAVAAAGGSGFVAGLAAFLLAHTLLAIACSAVVAGMTWGVFVTADWALGCRFLPRHALATAMGVWNLALLLPQVLAPLIATAVLRALNALQTTHAARIALVIAGCEVACGIAWIWRLPAYDGTVAEIAPSGNTA